MTVSRPTIKNQKVDGGSIPGSICPFPQILGIILLFTGLWNYPAHKSWPHHILRLTSPFVMAHVGGETVQYPVGLLGIEISLSTLPPRFLFAGKSPASVTFSDFQRAVALWLLIKGGAAKKPPEPCSCPNLVKSLQLWIIVTKPFIKSSKVGHIAFWGRTLVCLPLPG